MPDLAPVLKPPAFQFYARDWLSSTLGMPWDVAGVYIHLLAWSWDNGPLPDDPEWRRRIIGDDAIRLWSALESRWKKTRRGLVNRRLERHRKAQQIFRSRAVKAATMRWSKHGLSIDQASANGMLGSSEQAMLEPCTASASASAVQDQDQPAAERPVSARPPFRRYSAIAKQAIADEPTDDLGEIAERFKRQCARQGLPYDATIATAAITAAITAARAAPRKRA